MKLHRAIIETAKEWIGFFRSVVSYMHTEDWIAVTKLIWIVFPFFSLFFIGYTFHFSWWIVLFGFVGCGLWALFWIGVFENLGVTSIHHYDEEKKEWVTDYEEKNKK